MKGFQANAIYILSQAEEGRVLIGTVRDSQGFMDGSLVLTREHFEEIKDDHDRATLIDVVQHKLNPLPAGDRTPLTMTHMRYGFYGVYSYGVEVNSAYLVYLNILSPKPFVHWKTKVPMGCCHRCLVAMPIGHTCTICEKSRRLIGWGCSLTTNIVEKRRRKLDKNPYGHKVFAVPTKDGTSTKYTGHKMHFNPGLISLLFHNSEARSIKGKKVDVLRKAKFDKTSGIPVATNIQDCHWQFSAHRTLSYENNPHFGKLYNMFKKWHLGTTVKDEPETDELVAGYEASALLILLSVPPVKAAIHSFAPLED